MTDRRYLLILAATAVLLLGLAGVGAAGLMTSDHRLFPWAMMASTIPLGAFAWLSIHVEGKLSPQTQRTALIVILASAALMRLIFLPTTPLSTDIYRYIWDGRVQGAGINPYRYFPVDLALQRLRDPDIFPNINRAASAPTIYPPLAQMSFFAVTRLSEAVWAMKLMMVGFEAVAVAGMLALLRGRGLSSLRIMLYAWHPLVIFEFSGGGHVDAIAIAFLVLACLAADRARLGLTGLLLAAATLAKFFPLVIAPALYRRWDWRAPLLGATAVAAGYAVYIGVGWGVFGYLSGYVQEENLTRGDGFFLLGAIARAIPLPQWASTLYTIAGGALLLAIALFVMLRRESNRPSLTGALTLLTAFTVVLSPHLPWYFSWLVPLLCCVPSISIFYLTAAAPVLYAEAGVPDGIARAALIYVPFALLLVIEYVVRSQRRIDVKASHQ